MTPSLVRHEGITISVIYLELMYNAMEDMNGARDTNNTLTIGQTWQALNFFSLKSVRMLAHTGRMILAINM